MRIKKIILSSVIGGVVGWSSFLHARGDAGDYGAMLAYWGPTARSLGMAGAFSGLADDGSAPYFNPGALVQLNTQELSFMHSIVFAGTGVSADVLVYARPVSAISAFGVTIFHLYAPKCKFEPSGGIDLNKEDEENGYTFTNREVALLLTYCTRFIDPVWMGINMKLYHHMIHRYSALGYGGDLGFYFFPNSPFSLGLTVLNLVKPSVKLVKEESKAKTTLRGGFCMRPWGYKVAVVADMIWAEGRRPVFGIGIEYRPFLPLFMRIGFNPSFAGFGVGLWKDQRTYEVRLDYSTGIPIQGGSMLGFPHNFSLSLLFGGYRAKGFSPTVEFSPTSGEEGKNVAWLYFNIKPRTEVRNWQVLIKDEVGTVVRKIGAWGEPPYRISWDGKDDNSVLVPDGKYYYDLNVIEKDGRKWHHEGFLAAIYTVGPPGTVIMKHKGEPPKYILEEREEEKKEKEKRRGRRTRRRGRRLRRRR